jgi:hypothetical protein
MQFTRVDREPGEQKHFRNACFLINDNWDDFTFKTTFGAVLFDEQGGRHSIGGLKILQRGMTGGRVPLPATFVELGNTWCSLGIDRDYYLNVSKLD